MTDQDLVAKFLAERGATVVAAAPAYGVDAEADKAARRARREAERFETIEHEAERYAEDVREAYHTGGRRAAIEAMNGRGVRLNRY